MDDVLGGGIGGAPSKSGRCVVLPWPGAGAGEVATGAAWAEDSGFSLIAEKAEANDQAATEAVT